MVCVDSWSIQDQFLTFISVLPLEFHVTLVNSIVVVNVTCD